MLGGPDVTDPTQRKQWRETQRRYAKTVIAEKEFEYILGFFVPFEGFTDLFNIEFLLGRKPGKKPGNESVESR